jgi:hypothetical protein
MPIKKNFCFANFHSRFISVNAECPTPVLVDRAIEPQDIGCLWDECSKQLD